MKRLWLGFFAALLLGLPMSFSGCGGDADDVDPAGEVEDTADLTEEELETEQELTE